MPLHGLQFTFFTQQTSPQRPGFGSQNSLGGSHRPLSPAPGISWSLVASTGFCMHAVHTYSCGLTQRHRLKIKKLSKETEIINKEPWRSQCKAGHEQSYTILAASGLPFQLASLSGKNNRSLYSHIHALGVASSIYLTSANGRSFLRKKGEQRLGNWSALLLIQAKVVRNSSCAWQIHSKLVQF